MNGAALVQTGDLFKVVPIDPALTAGAMPQLRPLPNAGMPGFGVQVVPLRFVSATELGPVLEPFTPLVAPSGWTRGTTSCCWRDRRISSRRCAIWSRFSTSTGCAGCRSGCFRSQRAAAPELAAELDQVFGGTEAGPLAGVVRVVPIERLNSILVVSSQPSYLEEAETWVQRLDRTSDAEEPQIYVYPVQNARASNLAEVLSGIFGAEAATVSGASLLAPGRGL